MRVALITVTALIVGVALGAVAARVQCDARLAALAQERDEARVALAKAEADGKTLAQRLSASEAASRTRDEELAALQERVQSLRGQVRAVEETAAVPRDEVAPIQDAAQAPLESDEPPLDAAAQEERDWRRARQEESRVDEARRDEQRQAFREDFRGRMDTFFQDAMNSAPDRTSQERIAGIQDNIAYLEELREAMRNATTDEEREALRQTMMDTGATLGDLVHAQQDVMLRNLATEFGVKDDKGQETFVAAARALQENPFFHARDYAGLVGMGHGPMGGGGFGGGRPGPGGNR